MTSRSAKRQADEALPFELKGSLFTLTVMYLRQVDLAAVDRHLAEKVKQAPGFFKNAPVIIDLEPVAADDVQLDFAALHDTLRNRGLIPVGVRNGTDGLRSAAVMAGLPLMPEARPGQARNDAAAAAPVPEVPAPDAPETQAPDEPALGPPGRNRMMTHPIRSGQQVYAAEGDLILLGAVSPGAEVLADGNIHVYGPLRGRALAGVKGDLGARIFCQSMEAELVSIAGRYRVMEEVDAEARGRAVQIYLVEDRLIIEPLAR